jgi:hypothetical protein
MGIPLNGNVIEYKMGDSLKRTQSKEESIMKSNQTRDLFSNLQLRYNTV